MVLCKKLGVLTNYFRPPFEIVNEGVIKYLKLVSIGIKVNKYKQIKINDADKKLLMHK